MLESLLTTLASTPVQQQCVLITPTSRCMHHQRQRQPAQQLPRADAHALLPPAQGSARVIRCLQNQRDKLTTNCRVTLFDEEVRFSENIDFQYPMKKVCAQEVEMFCKDVPHGNGRVIRCLQVSSGTACQRRELLTMLATMAWCKLHPQAAATAVWAPVKDAAVSVRAC
jgi:hypothetical protein